MAGIDKVCEFLDKTQTYYLATVEGDQPRVRPFGTALVYDGKLYIQTGKVKPVSKQLAINPKAEICAFDGSTGVWLRVAGELINGNFHRFCRPCGDDQYLIRIKYPDSVTERLSDTGPGIQTDPEITQT